MTFISYPNISTKSDCGVYRIEITGTPADEFFRNQPNFIYRLYHLDQLNWEWSADGKLKDERALDDYPHEAWVNDQGWSVVRLHEWFRAGLLVISPDGQVVLRRLHRRIFDDQPPGFLEAEPEEHMGDSSAGPFWAESAVAYFIDIETRPFWIIRTQWGYRVIIDLERASFIDTSVLEEDAATRANVDRIEEVLLRTCKCGNRIQNQTRKLPNCL